jgi:hypothetical protein
VRKLVGIEYEDLAFDQEWLVADLRVNERGLAKLPKVSIQYCEPSRPSTYLVGVGSHRRWELMLHPGETNPDPWKLLGALDHARRRRAVACRGLPVPRAGSAPVALRPACSSPAMPPTSSRRSPARACARGSATWPT